MIAADKHVADATALVAPLTSLWATGSSVLSVILTCMGIVWYAIQITKWYKERKHDIRTPPQAD